MSGFSYPRLDTFATLDETGKVPVSQLPDAALQSGQVFDPLLVIGA